jgi:hypothetical protein
MQRKPLGRLRCAVQCPNTTRWHVRSASSRSIHTRHDNFCQPFTPLFHLCAVDYSITASVKVDLTAAADDDDYYESPAEYRTLLIESGVQPRQGPKTASLEMALLLLALVQVQVPMDVEAEEREAEEGVCRTVGPEVSWEDDFRRRIRHVGPAFYSLLMLPWGPLR